MDDVAHRVEPPSPGTAGHLSVFVGMQDSLVLSVEFGQTGKDGGFDGTVEADGKGFGGKEDFDVTASNHEFDHFSQNGNHAAVVNANALFQQSDDETVFGHLEILLEIGQFSQHLFAFSGNGVSDLAVVFQHGNGDFLGARLDEFATKGEENGGQHAAVAQKEQQMVENEFAGSANALVVQQTHELLHLVKLRFLEDAGGRQQWNQFLGGFADGGLEGLVLERFEPGFGQGHIGIMGQGHHAVGGGGQDDLFWRFGGFNPRGEAFGVVDGGTQHDHLNVIGEHQNGLFPDVAAVGVVDVVDFVENDAGHVAFHVQMET